MEEHNDAFRAQDSEEQLLPVLFDIPAEGKIYTRLWQRYVKRCTKILTSGEKTLTLYGYIFHELYQEV